MSQTKHSLEESDDLARDVPNTKRVGPVAVNARGPQSAGPPRTRLEIASQLWPEQDIDPHLFPTTEFSAVN